MAKRGSVDRLPPRTVRAIRALCAPTRPFFMGRKFSMSRDSFHRLIASSALPEAPLLRARLLTTMCV
eukprot:4640493-Pleurochrysis_carterae.AAC.1